MKRLTPLGPTLLEEEDIDQLSTSVKLKLMFVYGFQIGAVVGLVAGALL